MVDSRINVDKYFMEIAETVAKRSTCLRHNVGAVMVKEKQILSTGYNGAPSGMAHCLDIGCIRDKLKIESGKNHEICRAVHAEQNAVIQAALHGVNTEEATLYCTHAPCSLCAKILINAKVRRVVYKGEYPDDYAKKYFDEAGVKVERVD